MSKTHGNGAEAVVVKDMGGLHVDLCARVMSLAQVNSTQRKTEPPLQHDPSLTFL
jgi:hypothetical protein